MFKGDQTTGTATRADRLVFQIRWLRGCLDRSGQGNAAEAAAGPANEPPVVSITSPADGASFDSGATILFEGTASDPEEGDLTDSLVWTSSIQGHIGVGGSFSYILEDGNHIITASVTDSGGQTGSDGISITVGSPSEPTTVSVSGFTYATTGGRDGKKHLSVTVALVDDLGDSVAGASVSILLEHDLGSSWTFTGTTGSDGTVTFSLPNAPSGCRWFLRAPMQDRYAGWTNPSFWAIMCA